MNSVPTLKSSAISKFAPGQLKPLIKEMEKRKFNFEHIIVNDLAKYNTNIDKMINFNLDYGGWWGCPHRVNAYTICPHLISDE